MKKFISSIVIIVLLMSVTPAVLAASEQLIIDGVIVVSDVQPEKINNRVMVPIRVVAENLGLNVEWKNEVVTLTDEKHLVTLTTKSNTVVRNGEQLQIDVKPYLKQERVYVPIRFIAETFGSTVDYQNNSVIIDSRPLYVDGEKVKTVTSEYHMTMGGVINEIKGHSYHQDLYQLIIESIVKQVDTPEQYGWIIPSAMPDWYRKNIQYQFVNVEGEIMKQFDIYSLSYQLDEKNKKAEKLLHDVNEDKWFSLNEDVLEKIQVILDKALQNGFFIEIENTVV